MESTFQKIKYRESDYLYGTARVRALEKHLLSGAAVSRMLDAPDEEGVIAVLREVGIPVNEADIEASLGALLAEAFDECAGMTADVRTVDILRYPYDAHNIKSAIKCNIRGVDPAHLLSEVGSVPAEDIVKMPQSGDFSLLPPNMAEAAKQAVEDFAANRDPQRLSALIDAACYKDMFDSAEATEDPFFAEWVRARADTANILTAVRVMRMSGAEVDTEYLTSVLVPGGSLKTETFVSGIGDGEAALWQKISHTDYEPIVRRLDSEGKTSLTFIEKVCDDFCLAKAKTQKTLLASAGAVAVYAIATEYMTKDIRIIAAGKKSGSSNEDIRERLRDTYV